MIHLNADVVVIGAGAAGLAAARTLSQAGVDILVLEARDRVGGRAYTLTDANSDVAIELGAEFIHGTAETTFALMRETGTRALDDSDSGSFIYRNRKLTGGGDAWEKTIAILAQVDENAPDESVEEHLQGLRSKGLDEHEFASVKLLIEGFDAARAADASIKAIAQEWKHGGNAAQARPSAGYAPLMNHLARTVSERLLLQSIVNDIVWNAEGVVIRGSRFDERFEVRAKASIVTLPIGVLRENVVRFEPELPPEKRGAIDAILSGPVTKLVMRFRTPFWERVENGRLRDASFFQNPAGPFQAFWTMLPQRTTQLVAWAGGSAGDNVCNSSALDCYLLAIQQLAQMFPESDVHAELQNAYHHDWQCDPYARGAYSYMRVNGGNARDILRVPLSNSLFFAGEATASAVESGTVSGALDSGYRAANEVLTALAH